MSNQQMRAIVSSAYQGDSWKKKVKSMKDDQVTAVYLRLKKKGKVK